MHTSTYLQNLLPVVSSECMVIEIIFIWSLLFFRSISKKSGRLNIINLTFFIKGYDPFHYSTLSPRNNHIFHEQKRYKWSDTIYTRYQLYFSLFSCWAKPLELLSCNLVKKKDPVQTDSPCIFFWKYVFSSQIVVNAKPL